MKNSDGPSLLGMQLRAMKLPAPVFEYRFDDTRKFRLDLAWPDRLVAAEVHGSVWAQGRHTRGQGFTNDRVKMNLALERNWRVFEYTTEMVESGEAVQQLKRVLR